MRVLAVAQAYKGSLAGSAVRDAMASGIAAAGVSGKVLIGSDGGDGLLDALDDQLTERTVHGVRGPLGDPVRAAVGWLAPDVAVIESRLVCGLELVPTARRNPERVSTAGLGELIAAVGDAGARTVYVGLGGSATMDGGVGMRDAWGDAPARMSLIGLCDVDVPLAGAERFAAQKGADGAMRQRLAARLGELGAADPPAAALPGAGAAGGLGFGLVAWGGGRLVSGADWVLDRIAFDAALEVADLVVATEGAFDGTSLAGKLSGTVLARATAAGRRVGLVTPSAATVPAGVVVETGGGRWTPATVAGRTETLVRRVSGT